MADYCFMWKLSKTLFFMMSCFTPRLTTMVLAEFNLVSGLFSSEEL